MFITTPGNGGPELYLGNMDLFRARCTSFHNHASLLTFFICVVSFSILALPVCKRCGQNSSFTFPISILIDACFFSAKRNSP